jgi:cobyrinic acid a,c-diamide synthase
VKDSRGKTGWIDQQLVRSVRGSQLIFQGMNVDPGYIDNPTIIFISGTDSRDDERILLERSFAEALRDNTDRESVERSAVPAK